MVGACGVRRGGGLKLDRPLQVEAGSGLNSTGNLVCSLAALGPPALPHLIDQGPGCRGRRLFPDLHASKSQVKFTRMPKRNLALPPNFVAGPSRMTGPQEVSEGRAGR